MFFLVACCPLPVARLPSGNRQLATGNSLHAFDKVRSFPSLFEPHVGFAPVAALAGVAAHPLHFATDVEQPDVVDLYVEQLLDGVLDLDLVGLDVDLEGDDVRSGIAHHGRLLRHQRTADDLIRVHDWSASVSRCRASWERTM